MQIHEIKKRKPIGGMEMAMVGEFELGPTQDIDERELLKHKCWTLYSFDFEKSEALFVDIGAKFGLAGDMSLPSLQ